MIKTPLFPGSGTQACCREWPLRHFRQEKTPLDFQDLAPGQASDSVESAMSLRGIDHIGDVLILVAVSTDKPFHRRFSFQFPKPWQFPGFGVTRYTSQTAYAATKLSLPSPFTENFRYVFSCS